MKINIHSQVHGWMLNGFFYDSLKKFADELVLKEKGVKKIQLYCDFFLPDGTFPFADEDTIYYPATLIYKPNLWKIHWICWKKTALHTPTATISPYIFNEVAPIESCECVPEKFQKMVEGKTLYFHQNSKYAMPEKHIWEPANRGMMNTGFLDELSRQISQQLIDLSGCNLSPKWSIRGKWKYWTPEKGTQWYEKVVIDGVNYRLYTLSNPHAEGRHIGVCWRGPYDQSDDITGVDIEFQLTDLEFNNNVKPLEEVAEFIQTSNLANNISYPDVQIVFHLKENVDGNIKTLLLNAVGEYVCAWNDNEDNNEKIHDFFLLDKNETERRVTVFVDFGSCNPIALIQLATHLSKGIEKHENIERISFE